ncbi:MAG: beta strand repeat-containing protein, partial [Phycisphaerae bacterium]
MSGRIIVVLGVTGLVASAAMGAGVWTPTTLDPVSGQYLWTEPTNWDDGVVPGASSVAYIGSGGTEARLSNGNRDVGVLVFNVDADFLLTAAWTDQPQATLRVKYGIEVSPPSPHTYTINSKVAPNGLAQTFTVSEGSTLKFTSWYDSAGFTKTGTGTLEIWGTWSAYGFTSTGNVDVLQGTVTGYGATFSGPVHVAEGAVLTVNKSGQAYNFNGKVGTVSLIEGTIGDDSVNALYMYKNGLGTLRFTGNGIYKSGGICGSGHFLTGGVIELDNSVVNLSDRWSDNDYYPNFGSVTLKMIGNETTDSSEYFHSATAGGDFKVLVLHGTSANASVTFGSIGPGSTGAYGIGLVTFSGNDDGIAGLNGSGLYTSKVFGALNKDGLYSGGTAQRVCPYARIGMEFATNIDGDGTNQVIQYAGVGRLNDIATAISTTNILIDSTSPAQTLAASATINSLKIDGAYDINLGGNELTIGASNGGGIIKTGTGPSVISGGAIRANTGGNGIFYITNDSDLTITADVKAVALAKNGSGFLSLGGNLTGVALRWLDGSLGYSGDANLSLAGANNPGPGYLQKDNANSTLTLNGFTNYTTGGIIVNAGTVKWANAASPWGTGPLTIAAGAHVDLGVSQGTVTSGTINLSGELVFAGVWNTNLSTATVVNVPAGATGTINMVWGTENYKNKAIYGITGSGTLCKTGTAGLDFQTATGSSTFTGTLDIEEGWVRISAANQLPPSLNIYVGPNGYYNVAANLTLPGCTYAGVGTIYNNANAPNLAPGAVRTLTSANAAVWSPGAAAGAAGILKVDGNLAFSGTGTTWPKLALDLVSGNGALAPVAGTHHDQLAVSTLSGVGAVTGLAALDLSVNLAAKQNWLGDTLTVISSQNNLTGQVLHGINFNNTGFADVTVAGTTSVDTGAQAGWVTLSNISYPGDANRDGITDM